MISQNEVKVLCQQAQNLVNTFQQQKEVSQNRIRNIKNYKFELLENKVTQQHKSKRKLIKKFIQQYRIDSLNYHPNNTNLSRKGKSNLCTAYQIQESNYLYKKQRVPKSTISKRIGIPIYKLNKILQINNIENVQPHACLKNKFKFKKLHNRAKDKIVDFIKNSTSIITSTSIQSYLNKKIGLRVSKTLIQKFLKVELNMSYRKLHPITYRHNSEQSKLCRQLAACNFIQQLSNNKILVNIDESIINETDPRKYGWFFKNQKNFISHSQRLSKVSLIAAVSSIGDFYFTINYGKNNSDTFILFLLKLIKYFDNLDYYWRNKVLFVIDNASYHRSKKSYQFYERFRIPVMFLGPYHYRLAPVEMMFAYIKGLDINQLKSRSETKNQLMPLMKEICCCLSKIDTLWIKESFIHTLTHALENISLQNL